MKTMLWLIALAGCTESVADNFAKPPPSPTSTLSVELAAVTLGDDCAPPPSAQPPASPKPAITKPPESLAPGTPAAPARAAPGYRGHCDQTTMQLVIKTPASFKAGTVKIKKVELLDADGKLLQTLAARNPRSWGTVYQPWDEKLGPAQHVKSMYDLAAPDWNKLTNGRWNAHSKAFQVRVLVEVGGANKTVTKSAITAARLPPPVPT